MPHLATSMAGEVGRHLKSPAHCAVCYDTLEPGKSFVVEFGPFTVERSCFHLIEQTLWGEMPEVVRWYHALDQWRAADLSVRQAAMDDVPVDTEVERQVIMGYLCYAVFRGGRSLPDSMTCEVCERELEDTEQAYMFGKQICKFCYPAIDLALIDWRDQLVEWYGKMLIRQQDRLRSQEGALAALPI